MRDGSGTRRREAMGVHRLSSAVCVSVILEQMEIFSCKTPLFFYRDLIARLILICPFIRFFAWYPRNGSTI